MDNTPTKTAYWTQQSPWSDPGTYAAELAGLDADPAAVGQVARNLIAHYRASADVLPASSLGDINLMRITSKLDVDAERHPGMPLTTERPEAEKLQGCCRDHTLMAVSILRAHGIPARSRVGFASYFEPDWHHDHVVVEYHDGTRWVRFDPEVGEPWPGMPHPRDLNLVPGAFETAAEVWLAHRREGKDLSNYGVGRAVPHLSGRWFAYGEVFLELNHRYATETLLWLAFGAMVGPEDPMELELIDEVADLLVRADAGDADAEAALYERWRTDDRLHPGETALLLDPNGGSPSMVNLATAP